MNISFCACVAAVWTLSVVGGEVRYLAADGDDAADGRSAETAWRTIGKLNADLPPGGTALLRRGDVFYGGLSLKAGPDGAHPTVLADYGTGAKPVISGAKIVRPDPSVWEDFGHDIWRVNLSVPANSTGLTVDECNPGFLLVGGEVKPWKRFSHSDLVSPWDFCGEDGWLYVHAPENPAVLSRDIRVALNVHGVFFRSHTVISNVAVRATGAHGMYGGWRPTEICEDVRISDCDFENVGGSELINFSPKLRMRYGNGVEFGSNCRSAVVERCTFRGVYDVAVTMQGYPTLTGWNDIHFRDCTMTDCSQAFEVWCQRAAKGMGFQRCSFTGNRTLRVGGGWGPVVRPMRACATPLLVYSMDTDTVDITVTGNTFEIAPRGLMYKSGGLDSLPKGYRVLDNDLRGIGGDPARRNPAFPGLFSDPELLWSEQTGRCYVYPSTDGFPPDWREDKAYVFSSADMLTWRKDGCVFDLKKDCSWADVKLWAPCAIERRQPDGGWKYFWYFAAEQKLGVAVGDRPEGPFRDALGRPLLAKHLDSKGRYYQLIDPDVFCDPKTGTCHLYWGNACLVRAELAPSMIEIGEPTFLIDRDTCAKYHYTEGTHVFYRKGLYYFSWSEFGTEDPRYCVRYLISDSPTAFVRDGRPAEVEPEPIVSRVEEKRILGTGHHSVVCRPGTDEWYIAYHRFCMPNVEKGGNPGFNREVCVDRLEFAPDGRVRRVDCTP